MAYPHAPVEVPLYLRIPHGFDPRREMCMAKNRQVMFGTNFMMRH